ncbi:hypothetical protein DFR67_105288 [Williamsia limnetica]|uniref:Dynamin family protein n=1 Tax=Williamsia limnetica TaxID=882452 RepID=A0A318RXI0_WILLI|nr:hypothetical protein [Williamsia limnetica]PYE18143.1 hypothetical protein DFR67_105288 [Williamsia limnetica]
MTVDVQDMREVIAQVAALTGRSAAVGDSVDVVVAGIGRVGVTAVMSALEKAGWPASEWGPGAAEPVAVALVILDPSSGVGSGELELLRRVQDDAAVVALVCNKIDAFWDWPTLLKVNRALLDPDGRFPIFAVSAAAALAGHRDESGFAALEQWIGEQLDPISRPERLATVAAERELGELIDDLASRDRADPATPMLTERAAVHASRDRGRADRLAALRGGAGQIRGTVLAEVAGSTRDIAADATGRAAELSRSGAADFADHLAARLDRLRDRIRRRTADEIGALEARTMLGLEDPEPAGPPIPPPPVGMPPLPSQRRGAEEALLVVFGASAGLGLGRLVVTPMSAVDTLQWISMPLTLILGVVIATGLVRLRRLSARRTSMSGWAQTAIADARSGLEQEVSRQLLTAEAVIGGRVTRHYERRAHLAADRVAELDRQIRERRRSATLARETDNTRLAAAIDVRDRIDQILADID